MKKVILLFVATLLTGCVSSPYIKDSVNIQHYNDRVQPEWTEENPQIERGQPNKILDASGWVSPFSLIGKLVIWNTKVDNHDISPETESVLREYIEANKLQSVKVRLNMYAPGEEWHRLVNNKGVGAGWRYTIGVLSWLGYTIFPGRVFGGDNYNPYTNTINLYSDLPTIGLHEGGHAKDIASAKNPGTYSFGYIFPFAPLYYEAKATNDALSYSASNKNYQQEYEGYRTLYPAYGTYVGGASAFFTGEPVSTIIGGLIGQMVGRVKASDFKDEIEKKDPKAFENINR